MRQRQVNSNNSLFQGLDLPICRRTSNGNSGVVWSFASPYDARLLRVKKYFFLRPDFFVLYFTLPFHEV